MESAPSAKLARADVLRSGLRRSAPSRASSLSAQGGASRSSQPGAALQLLLLLLLPLPLLMLLPLPILPLLLLPLLQPCGWHTAAASETRLFRLGQRGLASEARSARLGQRG